MKKLVDSRGIETTVYEPAEDSHLLATAAQPHVSSSDLVLDVGTGSGYVAATLAATTGARVVGVDVNPHACARAYAAGVQVIRGDLVSAFRDDQFDVVCCNPPYLPTEPEAEWDDWMELALSGGPTGRRVVEPFLDDVGRVLASDGCVLLLASSLMDVDRVVDRAASNGFDVGRLVEESYPFETLTVVKLVPW